jgi:hypothetical protein
VPASSKFDLDVVGVTQDDEGTPALSMYVLNTRMRHSERVEALFPGFKGSEVAYTKRHMVKPDPALVKGCGIALVDGCAPLATRVSNSVPSPAPHSLRQRQNYSHKYSLAVATTLAMLRI